MIRRKHVVKKMKLDASSHEHESPIAKSNNNPHCQVDIIKMSSSSTSMKKCENSYRDQDVDDIQEILERKKAADQLPQHVVEMLRDLVIKLRHEVPPQHDVERACGSHVPTPTEKKTFARIVHPERIKKGVFSGEEDQRIVDNWKAFCKMHNWKKTKPKPFIYMRHNDGFYLPKHEERKKFVQFLADGLPLRTLYSVYHRFRNLYDVPKVRSKYNEQEDDYIIKYIEQNDNVDETRMFSNLAKVLDRTRASVWRRYRLLKRKKTELEMDD